MPEGAPLLDLPCHWQADYSDWNRSGYDDLEPFNPNWLVDQLIS